MSVEQQQINKKYNFKEVLGRVHLCLQYKIRKNWTKIDKNNLYYLGNVGFGYDSKNGSQYLVYNREPNTWSIKDVIKDIEDIEYEMYQANLARQGVI